MLQTGMVTRAHSGTRLGDDGKGNQFQEMI